MVTSPFSSRVRRPILPPIGLQSVFREVRTEDELRQALTPLNTTSIASVIANTGRRIVIAAPITLKSPIIIDASLPGTIIESQGYLPIFCGVDGIDAFEVRAPSVMFRGLLFYHEPTTSPKRFRYVISAGGSGATGCRVIDVDSMGAETFISNRLVGSPTGWTVRGCSILTGGNVSAPGIDTGGIGWTISGCSLQGSSGGVAVSIAGGGGACAIVGNDCNNDGITTSISNGLNTVSANTRGGTLTTHATDAVGLNT